MKNWEFLVLAFVGGIFWNAAKDLLATFTKLPEWANNLLLALIVGVLVALILIIIGIKKRK